MLYFLRQKVFYSAESLCHVILQKYVACHEQNEKKLEGDLNDFDYVLQFFDAEVGPLANENGLRCETKPI